VEKIKDIVGRLCSTPEEIEVAFVEFFTSLFTTPGPQTVDTCTSTVDQKISPEMNVMLIAPFCDEEVKQAMDQMSPIKAPGSDRFIAGFFQK
jgi:hypothetical protein